MQLTHSFSVPASIDTAWATFMDLREVGECFPGASVTDVSGDSFTGQVKVKLGPIAMVYTGTGTFTERDDHSHRAVITAEGKDKRGNGTAGATATIQLSPDGVDRTQVDVTTDLLVTGKPAQFGRGVMQDVSDKLLGQFVHCIEGKLSTSPTGSASRTSAGRAGASAQAEPAAVETTGSAAAPTGPDRSAAPLGTAAMFGATAGAGSWESLSGAASTRSATSVTSTPAGPEPVPATPTPGAAPAAPAAASGSDDAVDLGATVLPVLLKSYGREVGIGAVAFIVGWKLGRLLPG